jgi:hypothetical protein
VTHRDSFHRKIKKIKKITSNMSLQNSEQQSPVPFAYNAYCHTRFDLSYVILRVINWDHEGILNISQILGAKEYRRRTEGREECRHLLREARAQEILQQHRRNGNGRHIDIILLKFCKILTCIILNVM